LLYTNTCPREANLATPSILGAMNQTKQMLPSCSLRVV
jgi:hypothetical protein